MTSERFTVALSCLGALLMAGCATTQTEDGVREYLDEETAATVTVGVRAMIFARERPELAVNARDYLTLVPVDVNRSGAHAQYFYAYAWSTIDKRGRDDEADQVPHFALVADGRHIPLVPVNSPARDLGLGAAPLPPPVRSAQPFIAATTREIVEFVAHSEEVRAVAEVGDVSARYALWQK